MEARTAAMNARAVNVAILLLLVFEVTTGFDSFLVGEPDDRWLFWLHRASSLVLVVLLEGWHSAKALSPLRPRQRRRRAFGSC